MQFPQESQFDAAFGDLFRRVFVPQHHPVGDAKLGRQQLPVDGVLGVIGAHPSRADGHGRQWRIEAIEMEEQRAEVATQQHGVTTRSRTHEAERGGGGGQHDAGFGFDHLINRAKYHT